MRRRLTLAQRALSREAAAEAGRDPSELKCIVCAPSHITDDIADAREQVRWFPAMVSNHVQDLIERYGTVANTLRRNIDEADEAGDADTADIFTAASRDLDKALWFLEAHVQEAG